MRLFRHMSLAATLGLLPVTSAVASAPSTAPSPFDAFLGGLQAMAPSAREVAVRALIDEAGHTPIVRGTSVLFLAEGDGEVHLHGDFNGGGEPPSGAAMQRIAGTRWLYRVEQFAPDARIEYTFAGGDGRARRDPQNPYGATTFGDEVSELRMPGFRAPAYAGPALAHGRLVTFVHRSRALGYVRLVTVYVPHGVDAGAPKPPTLYFGDGQIYVDAVQAPGVIDTLIGAGRIPPVFAVFVPPAVRAAEYMGNPAYREMVTAEIVPLVERRYHTGGERGRRSVVGSSRGAYMALDLLVALPAVFGGAGLIAPAVRGGDVLTRVPAGPLPTAVVVAEGLYDREWGPDARAVLARLGEAGFSVRHLTYPDGHNPTAWRHLLHELLPALVPARAR